MTAPEIPFRDRLARSLVNRHAEIFCGSHTWDAMPSFIRDAYLRVADRVIEDIGELVQTDMAKRNAELPASLQTRRDGVPHP